MRLILTLVFLIALLFPFDLFSQYGNFVKIPASARYVSGEIIVKIKPEFRNTLSNNNIQLQSVQRSAPNLKISAIRRLFPNHEIPENSRSRSGEKLIDISTIYSITFNSEIPVQDAINALWTEDAYDFMEPRYINTPFLVPSDPNLNNLDVGAYSLINAYTAWDLATGNHSVISGVVDTGYKFGIPDLDGNHIPNSGEVPSNNIDDDGNGYIDDVYGWDFAQNDNNVSGTILNPHGHLVNSRFACVTNNGQLYPGVAYNCGLRFIKAASNESEITHGYEGIIYAADNGVHVINCSWGSSNYTAFGETVVNYATINKNAAIVVAGGNTMADTRYYPAAFRRAISVGACSATGVVSTTFSSYNYSMDINSPTKGGYTSNAAPVVTGTVALTYRRFHDILGMAAFTPYQSAQRVRVTAVDNYALNPLIMTDKIGKGRLDMFNAVNDIVKSPSVRINDEIVSIIIGDGDPEIESGETVSIDLDFINWLDSTQNLSVTITPDAGCSPYISMIMDTYNPGIMPMLGTSSHLFSFSVSALAPPDLAINLKVSYTDPITGYTDFEYISLMANPNIINVTNNLLDLSATGKGNIGYGDYPYNSNGLGIQYNGLLSAIYEGGFLIGNSGTAIANNIRTNTAMIDNDFTAISRIMPNASPTGCDFEANTTFTDAAAPSPLGLSINMNLYNYSASPDDGYIILEYLITNNSGVARTGVYAGIFTDWDIYSDALNPNAYQLNVCGYDPQKKMTFANQDGYNDFYGCALLTDEDFTARAYTGASASFTDASKFLAISNVPTPTTASVSTPNDIMQFTGTGSFSISPGSTQRIAFVLVAGNSLNALNTSRLNAMKKYFGKIVGHIPDNTPAQSILSANMEETDAEGWTHYYKIGVENQLLLSLKKDNAMVVTPNQVTLGFGGVPYYTQITAPLAPYAANYPSGWYVMNRFWEVSPSVQPSNPVGVRFYYTPQDFSALQTNCPSLLTDNDLQFFKFTSSSGISPNPSGGHSGATYSNLIGINNNVFSLGDNHYGEFTVSSFSGGGVGETGNGISFPLQWLDFQATLLDNQVVSLKWTTESEVQNDYFTIERSVDGIIFTPIETISGQEDNTPTQNYTTLDKEPFNGTNYYRIRQTDLDGHFTFSPTRQVNVSKVPVVYFTISPNPAGEFVEITPSESSAAYRAVLMNMLGASVAEVLHTSGKTILPIGSLAKGAYHLLIFEDGFTHKKTVWIK